MDVFLKPCFFFFLCFLFLFNLFDEGESDVMCTSKLCDDLSTM